MKSIRDSRLSCFALLFATTAVLQAEQLLQTRHASLRVDDKGFVISLTSRTSNKEYSPAGHPSPLLSLHENGQPNTSLIAPASATFDEEKHEFTLKYPNGSAAVVKAEAKDGYFRFQLVTLSNRDKVDNIVWGPVNTNISGRIGDLLGVVRSEDFAIGLYGLDDNTIAGPVADGDCYNMGYTIHSTDPAKHPVPAQYKEGQWFGVGGDGISDTAFFSHPEEYFQYAGGNGAKLEPAFGSSVAYHARDRRKPYTHFFALMPNFKAFRARHMVSDPVPGVDFIGSAMALYACPDDMGLDTLEKITRGEGLPYITFDGKWVRDPSLYGVTLHWSGPRDKCIEYAKALGVKDISRDTGGWYPNLGNSPDLGQVGFANRPPMHFREFTEECHKNGLNHGGLHTLCVFLQGGQCNDVTPAPSAHLQTVCRTTLAKDISPTDTEIVVTDPSFLAEKGTWTCGDGSNFLRIDGEMLYYDGISDAAPWTLKGVKRGHGTKAQEHKAGAEVAKLMQNCYHGFVPDMELLLDYAEYYARMMVANGMDIINFDGFESTIYQNHGYYGTRIFCRRLFETYAKLSGGKYPRVTASNVFAGSWEYLNVCDLGDGPNMFNPHTGRLAIEGKDIGNAFRNSFFPATFGIQDWPGGSITDVENLQAKAVGWDATYVLKVSADTLDKTADQDILAAFRAWQEARAAQVFTKAQKEKLRNPDLKFHLEQTGKTSFVLSEAGEKSVGVKADDLANEVAFENKGETQPLDFVFKLAEPYSAPVSVTGLSMTLPDGSAIEVNRPFRSGERIFCRGGKAWLVDAESKTTELPLKHSPVLPKGGGKFGLCTTGSSKPGAAVGIWTVRVLSAPERIGK